MTAALSIIIPTFNEKENVKPLLESLEKVLRDENWEAIFVDDDSPDGTTSVLRKIALQNSRVRVLQRIGRRSLSSACIEGMLASAAPYMAVMDADRQHDESLLPQMMNLLRSSNLDIVIGSRYIKEDSLEGWHPVRKIISNLATSIARFVLKTDLRDPLSGYFMLKRDIFDKAAHGLSGKGFKILLDIIVNTNRSISYKELPYTFRSRRQGASKLNSLIAWEFILLLLHNFLPKAIPIRFAMFSVVGCLGALMHLIVLGLFYQITGFTIAQTMAAFTAMTMNFLFNNFLTYSDQRLRGKLLISGLLYFYFICAIGAYANLQVASALYEQSLPWWLAGLFGAIISSVWNYAVSSTFTWKATTRNQN
jgi:dolichol-phosphate mannosyltransferase